MGERGREDRGRKRGVSPPPGRLAPQIEKLEKGGVFFLKLILPLSSKRDCKKGRGRFSHGPLAPQRKESMPFPPRGTVKERVCPFFHVKEEEGDSLPGA